jgi:hypothetical protein
MKKKLTSIFLATLFLSATVSTSAFYITSTDNVVPGSNIFVTSATKPASCSARGVTPSTSNDHIKVTMTHNGDGTSYDWGTPNEVLSTEQGVEYWTQTSTTSCESYDGAKVYNYNNFTTIPIEVTYSLIPQ